MFVVVVMFQEKAEMEMKYVKEMSDIQDRFLQLQNKVSNSLLIVVYFFGMIFWPFSSFCY